MFPTGEEGGTFAGRQRSRQWAPRQTEASICTTGAALLRATRDDGGAARSAGNSGCAWLLPFVGCIVFVPTGGVLARGTHKANEKKQ